MQTFAILGAGAMGTALTILLTQNRHGVRLWGTELDEALLKELNAGHPHSRLGVPVHPRVQLYNPQELEHALAGADIVVPAITSDGVVSILQRAVPYLKPGQPLMMVTKGFGHDDERLPVASSHL